MADKIRGITIELNGDSTGLMKAIKGTNTELKRTQSSLKDVNKLLKFDPGNVQLLQQKQEYLKKAVDDTSKKLEEEKKVLEELKKSGDTSDTTEQQRALERQIAETEHQLESLKEEAKDFGNVASQQFQLAGDKIKGFGDKVTDIGKGMSANVSAPIVAVGAASLAAFSEVDSAMDTVVTKTGASGEALESMQNIVKDLATTLPTSFDDAGTAVGEVNTRFGLTGEELEKLSGKFLKFSEINGTDVNGTIDATSQALAAWGIQADQAGAYLDTLNKVGQNTGISVDTLNSAMASNAETFQQMGLGAADAANFLGQIELSGMDSSAAMKGMQTAMKNAAKEGKSLPEALGEMQKTMDSSKSDTEKLNAAIEMFGSKAGPQMFNAMQEGTVSLNDFGAALEDNFGSVDQTFEATLDPVDEVTTAMNDLKLAGADLGESIQTVLAPVLEQVADKIRELREWWEGLDPEMQNTIVTVGLIVAAIGPVLVIIGTVISSIGSIVGAVGAVIGVLGGPLTLAIAGAIAAGVAIAANWDTIKEKAGELKENISQKWNDIKQSTEETWNNIKENVSSAGTTMVEGVKTTLSNMKSTYDSEGGGLPGAVAAIMTGVEGAFQTGYDAIDELTGGKFSDICETFNEKTGGLLDKVTDVWKDIKDAVKKGVDKLKELMNFKWELPKLKLPHFKVNGEFSLNPPKVPSFSIDWYAKAMQNGMILNDATIFGAMNGKLLGAGEAGSEVVVGTQSLMNMIKSAVGDTINYGGINIVVYGAPGQDVNELADIISDRINAQVAARKAVFA